MRFLLLLWLVRLVLTPTGHVAASNLDVRALLQDASTAAGTIPDRELFEKVAALQEVAGAQAAVGDRDGARASVDIAFRTLAQASTTDAYRASAVVDLAKASAGGDAVELEQLLKRAAATSSNLVLDRSQGYALRNLAEALARSGSPSAAIARARGIADATWRQAALGAIAEIEAEAGSRPWVEHAVGVASGPTSRAFILARVARRWAETGDLSAARWAVAEALRLGNEIRTTGWRNAALVEIARAQVVVGDLEGTQRVASRIARSGDAWSLVEVLTVLGVARANAGDKAGALESLQRSREAALRLPVEARPKPGSPRGEALARTAAAYGQIGDGDTGSMVARAIPKEAPGREYLVAETLLTIARIQARAGDTDGARTRCGEAVRLLSNPADVVRYRWTCGDRAGAWRVLRESPGASTARWGLADAEARAGNLIDALEATEAIPDARSRVLALAALAPLQARLGDVAGARETARKVTDESRRAYAFQAVTWGRARGGDLLGAVDEAAMQQNPLVRSRMLLGVVEAQLGWSTGALSLSDTRRPWDLLPLKPE
jgi:hypothetical protein